MPFDTQCRHDASQLGRACRHLAGASRQRFPLDACRHGLKGTFKRGVALPRALTLHFYFPHTLRDHEACCCASFKEGASPIPPRCTQGTAHRRACGARGAP
jgi:hypothetical protein